MEDFRFAQPAYLLLLLGLPVLYTLMGRLGKNAHNRLLAFVSATNLVHLLKDRGGKASRWKHWFFWAGLACLAVALARPQANPTIEDAKGASLDIYVLIDVSRSMDAEDVPPSRLKKAKREIQSLMSLLSGDRVGLVAFAGSSVLLSPLTSDYEVVKTFLGNVDTTLIQNQSTDINSALELAEKAMQRGAERTGADGVRSNVFIVMSDGEDQEGTTDYSVADRIRAEGGTIFTIAFGTEAGAKIPARNDRGELMGYKRDRSGQEVITKTETKALQDIAARGGGQFYFSTLDEGEITDILNRVQGMQRSTAVTMKARVYQEYFLPVLALGALLIFLSFFTLAIRWQELIFWKRLALVFLVLGLTGGRAEASVLSFLWDKDRRASEEAQALAKEGKTDEAVDALKGVLAENPDSAPLNYNVGTYLLEGKKGEQGREQLGRSGGAFQAPAEFNVAGSYASEGKKDEARAAYANLISDLSAKEKLSPADQQILELAKKNVARLADPNQQPKQNQQDQKDQKDGQGKSGDNKDQKDPKDSKDQKDQKDQQKKDQDKKDQEKKDQDQKDQDKKDGKPDEKKPEDKKPEDKKPDDPGKDNENKNKPLPTHGRQPFKERDNMSEDDAKKLLNELKLNESGLQKKFLRKKENGGKFRNNDAAKDW